MILLKYFQVLNHNELYYINEKSLVLLEFNELFSLVFKH